MSEDPFKLSGVDGAELDSYVKGGPFGAVEAEQESELPPVWCKKSAAAVEARENG